MADSRVVLFRRCVFSAGRTGGLASLFALVISAAAIAQEFQPLQGWGDAVGTFAEQPEKMVETWQELRHNPNGPLHWKSRIPVDDPSEYPRIFAWDWHDEDHLFGTFRANLIGQDVEPEWDYFNLIATDRPDFTDATYTVGRGVTVLESGYSERHAQDRSSQLRETTRTLPELLIRYGVTDEFEVRIRWDGYIPSDLEDRPNGFVGHVFGDSDLTLSVKYEILHQEQWRPMITAVTGFTVPTGSPVFTADTVQPYLNLVAGWGLRRWIYLKVGGSVEARRSGLLALQGIAGQPIAPIAVAGHDNQTVFSTSVSLQFQVSKRIGGYTEFFGFSQVDANDNRGSTYFDTGVCYYLTPNVQLDAYWGIRLSQRIDEDFLGAGFSTRW